ncbi:MAG: rSAM-modified peptide [Ignavibacteriales bacterium]|nr:rSAM-modified peptide [Ignavibacteriales bacterium]
MKKLSIIELTREALEEKELSKIYGGESCISASCSCNYNNAGEAERESDRSQNKDVVGT